MDDRDWLDERLASGTYVADNGFTARVLGHVAAQKSRRLNVRFIILSVAAVLAAALVTVQSVSLARSLQQLRPGQLIADLGTAAGAHADNFAFLACVSAALSVLALAVTFAARRWS